MKNRRLMAASMLVLLLLSVFSVGITASAAYAYDVDFSIKPDKSEVNAGDTFNVDIVVTTRKSGYVEFDFELTYDESLVSCELDSFNQDGYIGDGTAEGIFKLTYKDPSNSNTPTPTEKDTDYTVRIAFKAKDVSQRSNVVFKGKINKLSGVNSLDNNKVKALTPATLVAKNVYILQSTTPVGSIDESSDDVSDEMISSEVVSLVPVDVPQQIVEEENNDTLKIALIIIGGLVVFGSGFTVGYMVRSKKDGTVSEKGYSRDSFGSSSSADYAGVTGLGNRNVNNNGMPHANNGGFRQPVPTNPEATSAQTFSQTSVPASQRVILGNNSAYVVSSNNQTMQQRPLAGNINADSGTYAQFGTPFRQAQQQNRASFSEGTYATNVPKYGTNFEGTYAQYANRQQQMQKTYAQQPSAMNYQQNRPMNNMNGTIGTYAGNSNAYTQQQKPATNFFGNHAQQQYNSNNANASGRFPTQSGTAYPINNAQTAVANPQYKANNQAGGYKPSQPSSITGGYNPSNPSNNGFNNNNSGNRPY